MQKATSNKVRFGLLTAVILLGSLFNLGRPVFADAKPEGLPAGTLGQTTPASGRGLVTSKRNGVTTYSLQVPYIHQIYDTAPALEGNCACGPTSLAMVLAYFGQIKAKPMVLQAPHRHT